MSKGKTNEINKIIEDMVGHGEFEGRKVYLFGCCNPTEKAMQVLSSYGIMPVAVLDNNPSKHGMNLNGVPVVSPAFIMDDFPDSSVVCIATRFFMEMKEQLDELGYKGKVISLADEDPYSFPSMEQDVIERKNERLKRGEIALRNIDGNYPGLFRLICPFGSLGDVVNALSYYPYYAKSRGIIDTVIVVTSDSCARISKAYGYEKTVVLPYNDMSELVQFVIWSGDDCSFVAHNDKPYVIDLADILKKKLITHEKIYCCGVYGLPIDTDPVKPHYLKRSELCEKIKKNKGIIISPYANSVTLFSSDFWRRIVNRYKAEGFEVYTNVSEGEKEIEGTVPISPDLDEMCSVVEEAGTFIGIRSGLCDVIRMADCRKIALYPNSYYSRFKWKLVDVFRLPGWENIEIDDEKEKQWTII